MRALLLAAAACLLSQAALAGSGPNHKDHPGTKGHVWAVDCLKPVRPKPPQILGRWKNACNYGVNIRYNLKGADGACEARSYSSHPCAQYIPANSHRPGYIKGRVRWIACRASGKVGEHGPFPMRTGKGGFGCYHLGHGPGRTSWRARRYGNGVFVGEIDENGDRAGAGEYYWDNGHVYTGEHRNDRRHGHGTYTWPSGDVYTGQWADGKRKGMTFAARERERREEAERQRRLDRLDEEIAREEEEWRRRRARDRAGGGFMDTFTRGLFGPGGAVPSLSRRGGGGGGSGCEAIGRRLARDLERVLSRSGNSMCGMARGQAAALGRARRSLAASGCASGAELSALDGKIRQANAVARNSCE